MEFLSLLGHPLPRSIVIEIFGQLSGGSLHKCRQVCHEWNNFILENVWGSRYGRKMIERRLEQNKSVEDLKFEKTEQILDIGVNNLEIRAGHEDQFVFICPDSFNRKKYVDLIVYNIKTEDTWKVAKFGPLRTEDDGSVLKPQVLLNESILTVYSVHNS